MNADAEKASPAEILIVDDDVASLRLLHVLMSEQGYSVRVATDGAMALESARVKQPDLILLDIRMPGIDGYEVCERLKSSDVTRDVPVIFLSVAREAMDKVRAFAVGGMDYVTKPFKAEEVLARVTAHLTIGRLQQQLRSVNEKLEARVRERTANLAQANASLQTEIIERKRAEEEYKRAQGFMQTVIDSNSDEMMVINRDCTIALANRSLREMVGGLDPVAAHLKCHQVTHKSATPCGSTEHPCPLEQVVVTKAPMTVEHTHRDDEGHVLSVEIAAAPIFDEEGEVVQIIESCRDITERKRADAALLESEERFRQVAENAQEWIWEVDYQGLYTYASPVVEKMLGYKPEEIVGQKHFYDLFHPDDREELKKAALQVFAKKQAFPEFTNRNLHKNGKVVWLSTNGAPILDEKGNLLGYRGADTDITERKLAEKALIKSENSFRQLFLNAPLAYQSLDETGYFIDVNDEWLRLMGYTREEILGRHFADVIVPDEYKLMNNRFMSFLNTGKVTNVEFSFVRKDKSQINIILDGRIQYDDDNRFQRTHCIIKDITAQKKAEQEREHARIFMQTVIDSNSDEMMVINRDCTIALANRSLREMAGGLDPVAARLKCHQITHKSATPCGSTEHPCPLEQVVVTKAPMTVEHTHRDDEGRVLSVEIAAAPIFDEKGEVVQIVESCRDITERKLADAALLESEERFRQVAENAQEWIWEVDQQGLYTYASPVVKKMLGYKPEEIVGQKHFYDLFHPDDREELKKAAMQAFAEKQAFPEFTNRNLHKNGKVVWLSTNGAPILDEKGNLLGYRGADTDITERKLVEEKLAGYYQRLRKANAQLRVQQEELEEFTYTVSHDLKAPVVSIQGFAKLLEERTADGLDEESSQYLSRIIANGETMVSLLADLLELSRSGQLEAETEDVDVAVLIEDTFDCFSVSATAKNIRLSVVGSLPHVLVQRNRLREAFANLIDNAIKYMPEQEQSMVEVGYDESVQCPDGSPGAFFVRDNGEGIPERFHEKVFIMFQRARLGRSEVAGSGAGLAIMKRIVEAHGGHVWLVSEPGKGSTFYLTLPLVGRDAPPKPSLTPILKNEMQEAALTDGKHKEEV